MATYRIRPCARLSGEITVHSAKNAVLPLMCGALLTRETVTIEQIPALTDVKTLTDILRDCGVLMHADQTEKIADDDGGFPAFAAPGGFAQPNARVGTGNGAAAGADGLCAGCAARWLRNWSASD